MLERPCPECGFVASAFPREQVGAMLRENAAEWQRLLASPNVARRPADDVWSTLEYACHVRDVCHLYDERLVLMLTHDDPAYPNWDQDQSAVDDRYAEHDPAVVGPELAVAAAQLADRFDRVTGTQWDRTGTRSDGARFTVDSFARYFIHDLIHHVHDVEPGKASFSSG